VQGSVLRPLLRHLDEAQRDDLGRALEEAVQSRDASQERIAPRDGGVAPGD
jgi:hypothetical protein